MLTWHEQWEAKLHHSIETHKAKPFAWGEHDFALSVCNHVQAMTGIDLAAAFRGQYQSEDAALAAMGRICQDATTLEHVVEQLAAQHGIPEIKPLHAQHGDVVLLDNPSPSTGLNSQALGIVHLNGRHVIATGPDGLRLLRLAHVRRAWRIGTLTAGAHIDDGDGRSRFALLTRTPQPPAHNEVLRLKAI